MPRSFPLSSSEEFLDTEKFTRPGTPDPRRSTVVPEESSSSSIDLKDIYLRGSRPSSVDSTVDTTSAPISFVNDLNDSNDSIGGIMFQPFTESSNEDKDIPATLFPKTSFRNLSKRSNGRFIQTSNRQSTPVPDKTTQSETPVDPEMIFKGWGVMYEVRSSVDQRKPCCIFCCCICFKCF